MAKLFILLLAVAVAHGFTGTTDLTGEDAYKFANTDGKPGITSKEFDHYWAGVKYWVFEQAAKTHGTEHSVTVPHFVEFLKNYIATMEKVFTDHHIPIPQHGFEETEVEEMVSHLDADKDGVLNSEELGFWFNQLLDFSGKWLKSAMSEFAAVPKDDFIWIVDFAGYLQHQINNP